MNLETVEETVREMFRDRGYTDIEKTSDGYITAKKGETKVCLKGIIANLNIAEMQKCMSLVDDKYDRIILVYKTRSSSSPVLAFVADMAKLGVIFELFPEQDLKINVSKHDLVPKHELLNEVEKSKLQNIRFERTTQSRLLPNIRVTDPIARYFGARKDDVFKIYRKSGIVAYRIVV